MKFGKVLLNGIVSENPVFIQMLGMCPVLAVTTTAKDGIGMGIATMAVLLGSNVVISLLKSLIPSKIRIPIFIVIIASFVTIVGLMMKAYLPDLDKSLGLFIPLIVVNCIILGRAEAFASKNSAVKSFADAVGMGLGFTIALFVLGAIREILGAGAIFGFNVFPEFLNFQPALIMILPPGAFLALGLLLALLNWVALKNKKEEV